MRDEDEQHRLKVIRDLRIAGARGSDNFRNIAEIAARVCDAPMAAITVIDEETRWFYASIGNDLTSSPRKTAICNLALLSRDPFIVEDLAADATIPASGYVALDPTVRFYAGFPIFFDARAPIGTLLVLDRRPRRLTSWQIELLERLAVMAVDAFRLHDVFIRQSHTLSALNNSAAEIERQRDDLKLANDKLEAAVDLARVGFWAVDLATGAADMSPALRRMMGVCADATLEDVKPLVDPEHWAAFQAQFEACAHGQDGFAITWTMTSPEGRKMWFRSNARTEFENGAPVRVRGCTQDVTEAIESRDTISKLSAQDALTGARNRRVLPLAFSDMKRDVDFSQVALTVMLIDVDHFKSVNDALGHFVGDQVLTKLSEIFHSTLRDGDVVGRLDGDEFMLILKAPADVDVGQTVAERLQAKVRATPLMGQFSTPITLSIGYAQIEDATADYADALRAADLAVGEAKVRGRNCTVRYSEALGDRTSRRDAVLKSIDKALDAEEIIPAYQVQMSLSTNEPIGFEALARWRHPEKGLLTPGAFFEALEHPFYGARISDAILQQAVVDARIFADAGLKFGRIAVNASEAQLVDASFAEKILDLCHRHNVPPSWLEIEVTEKILINHMSERIRATLRKVSDLGVTIAFDDFGTGHASLTHLRDFPINLIKIDCSFTQKLTTDAATKAITASLIQMAHRLDLKVVAEGIETPEVAGLLRSMDCDYGQGFLYSRAVTSDAVPALLSPTAGAA